MMPPFRIHSLWLASSSFVLCALQGSLGIQLAAAAPPSPAGAASTASKTAAAGNPDPLNLQSYKGIPQRLPLAPVEYFQTQLEANRLSKKQEVYNRVIHSRLFDIVLVNPKDWEYTEEDPKKRKNKSDSLCLWYTTNSEVKFSFSLYKKNPSFTGATEESMRGYGLWLQQKFGEKNTEFRTSKGYKRSDTSKILSQNYLYLGYQIYEPGPKRKTVYEDYFLEILEKYVLKISLMGPPEALQDPKIQESFSYYLKHMYFKKPLKK